MTVFKDDVARVDMALDEDGDVEVVSLFRDGNRWTQIEVSPPVVSPGALLAGLLKLGVLGLEPAQVPALAGVLGASGRPRLGELLLSAVKIADTENWRTG